MHAISLGLFADERCARRDDDKGLRARHNLLHDLLVRSFNRTRKAQDS
jgi:hypothetical protein